MGTIVETEQGRLEGTLEDSVYRFLGIPYAAPPVGELRWQSPAPAPCWDDVRDSSRFGPCAMQTIGATFDLRVERRSEDCLYLNVWTASTDCERNAPVMVWIHGGGHLGGAGSEDAFDGFAFAHRGVTLITFNYRLGAFGYLAHPSLGANFAVQDAVAALKWVRANVARFGGDPGNVTIFGESAGAVAVRALLCCPTAQGLFHKAVLESAGFERPAFAQEMTYERAQAHARRLFEKLGTSDPAELRALPSDIVNRASHELCGLPPPPGQVHTPANLVWVPIADGEVVPNLNDAPGNQGIPILMGCTANEARYFIKPGVSYREEQLERMTEVLCASAADRARAYCSTSGKSVYELLDEIFTTAIWTEPAYEAAQRFIRTGHPVYYYRFDRVSPGAARTQELAKHTAEIRYVFGTLTGDDYDARDREVSVEMQVAWIAFASGGVPIGTDGVVWPRFDTTNAALTIISETVETRPFALTELARIVNSVRTNPDFHP